MDIRFSFYPDRDGDAFLDDQPDECPITPGIAAFAGCPPLVRGAPSLNYDRVAGGVRLTRVAVANLATGTRVEVLCRRCGRPAIQIARRRGTMRIRAVEGRTLRSGDRIEVRLTHPRSRSGRYRFGAIGKLSSWPVKGSALGAERKHCTAPGSRKRTPCP